MINIQLADVSYNSVTQSKAEEKPCNERLLEGMEMMRQVLGTAYLASRQRKLENRFFDHFVGHLRVQDVPQELHPLHKPWSWKAEAGVIANVDLPPLHSRYGPKVWNAAKDLQLCQAPIQAGPAWG